MSTLLITSSLSPSEIQTAKAEPSKAMDLKTVPFFTTVEKAGLITDIALVALASVPILLIILSKNGINLGDLSGLGSLNLHAVYALIALGGVIVVADLTTIVAKLKMLPDINYLIDKNQGLTKDEPSNSSNELLNVQVEQNEEENMAPKEEIPVKNDDVDPNQVDQEIN